MQTINPSWKKGGDRGKKRSRVQLKGRRRRYKGKEENKIQVKGKGKRSGRNNPTGLVDRKKKEGTGREGEYNEEDMKSEGNEKKGKRGREIEKGEVT